MPPTQPSPPDGLTGIDAERVTAWCLEHLTESTPPLTFDLITGGRSNLTYEIGDAGGRRYVLRRPPVGRVLPSAHDVAREHRIIAALAGTEVPVPLARGLCLDLAVTGSPFYVMDHVAGRIVKTAQDAELHFDHATRRRIGDGLVVVLARLHHLRPDSVGLADLGRPDGYVERQLRRWHRQFEQSAAEPVPAVGEVHDILAAAIPEQQRTSIVHGDFRLDNCLIGPTGDVAAVLDWELCTTGDPLADLGLLLVYWVERGEDPEHMPTGAPTIAHGFPRRAELAERYAAASGLDISRLDFYVALGYWKLACIFAGINDRYASGAMADDGYSADRGGEQVRLLAARALAHARRLG